MNNVELQGRIHDIYFGTNFTIITLFIKRGDKANFPQVVFYPSEKSLVEDYKKNDYVNITANVISASVKETGKDNTPNLRFKQILKGLVIYPVRTEMSEKFHRDLGGNYEFKNEVLISGTVVKTANRNGFFSILVNPTDEPHNIWLSSYFLNAEKSVERFTVGSEVCAKCEVQTFRKQKDNQKANFYQNLHINYIDIPEPIDSDYEFNFDDFNFNFDFDI